MSQTTNLGVLEDIHTRVADYASQLMAYEGDRIKTWDVFIEDTEEISIIYSLYNSILTPKLSYYKTTFDRDIYHSDVISCLLSIQS